MQWITRLFKRIQKNSHPIGAQKITPSQAEMMLKMIQKTQEVELSCNDVHDLLSQYTEMALRGEDVTHLLPLVHHHLEFCPDCREEYEALSRILQAEI